jgi:hypothetical protein
VDSGTDVGPAAIDRGACICSSRGALDRRRSAARRDRRGRGRPASPPRGRSRTA